MNNLSVSVNDYEVKMTQTVSKVEISVLSLQLGKNVSIIAILKDKDNNFIKAINYNIEGQEYENWGNDDSYIINLVLQKLGMTKI